MEGSVGVVRMGSKRDTSSDKQKDRSRCSFYGEKNNVKHIALITNTNMESIKVVSLSRILSRAAVLWVV